MAFLLAVLSLIVGEEVAQLEPVTASPTNVYGCNTLLTQDDCWLAPYCVWAAAQQAGKRCVDDPCLRYPNEGCPTSQMVDDETYVCDTLTLPGFATAKHDCSDNPGTGVICRAATPTAVSSTRGSITYCEYTQLKDGSCPDTICMKRIAGGADNDKHCVKNSVGGTADFPCLLLTQTDCKLVPKCRWDSSGSGSCIPDYCFRQKPVDSACSGLTLSGWGTDITNQCVDWHPLSRADGTALDYCIHKDNTGANICYFGNKNVTYENGTDFPYDYTPNHIIEDGTYPTYNYGTGTSNPPVATNLADPDCGTQALPNCEGHGECQTIVNSKGAFAGKYCTDGKHAAANILRIPSLLVLLVVSAFVAMFTL